MCTTLVGSGLLVRADSGTYQGWACSPGDTVVLSLLDGRTVLYVHTRAGSRPVAVHYEIGTRLPAHCTASGKSLLAALWPAQVAQLYADGRFEAPTRHTITSTAELSRELERVRGGAEPEHGQGGGLVPEPGPVEPPVLAR